MSFWIANSATVTSMGRAGKGYHSQPDPLLRLAFGTINRHDLVLVVVFDLRPQFLD